MNRELAELGGRIDAVFFCPHGPDDGCRCRKPLPGLFETIGERYGVDAARTRTLVGDSLRDLQAGAAVGCEPHLVRTGKGARLDAAELAALRERGAAARSVHADLASFAARPDPRERLERGDAGRARLRLRGSL